ncbi:hypothetical protein [Streptomyces sp. MJP52]|uniref:hypothetical protein n=1 Tax=Streptomyces sp. MJP52 TaxID=2940555 RepID=UPI0024740550|nr:hypothetical protein [Streptomyces sp. MJP52]MDH6224849.1 hypothetical protein [Streptomyces sp. MJP52]
MRARLRAAAALAALLPLTACGIQETDVIEAGGGATIDVLPARQVGMILFFLSPDGLLMPSSRSADYEGADGGQQWPDGTGAAAPSVEETVSALLGGPVPPERSAGMDNDPSLPGPGTRVEVTVSDGSLELHLAAPLDGLSERAERQLVCTAAYAERAAGSAPVALRGTDGTRAPARCDLRPDPEPATTGTAPR